MCGGLPAGALPLDPVGGFMRGAARPPLGAPCGGLPAPPWGRRAGGCPPPAPPGPLLKKAGENLLEDVLGFATECAGPPLMGSVGLGLFVGRRGGKGLVVGSLGWWKIPAARGGRRARTARTKQGRGPLAPAPALVLRALRARKTPPPPGVTQRRPPTPAPAHPRRPYGGCLGAQEGWGDHAGGRRRSGAGAKGPGP